MLDSYFKLSENGTSVRTEIIAGVTTFLTLAYIMFVNPSILAEAAWTMARYSSPPVWRRPSGR